MLSWVFFGIHLSSEAPDFTLPFTKLPIWVYLHEMVAVSAEPLGARVALKPSKEEIWLPNATLC